VEFGDAIPLGYWIFFSFSGSGSVVEIPYSAMACSAGREASTLLRAQNYVLKAAPKQDDPPGPGRLRIFRHVLPG